MRSRRGQRSRRCGIAALAISAGACAAPTETEADRPGSSAVGTTSRVSVPSTAGSPDVSGAGPRLPAPTSGPSSTLAPITVPTLTTLPPSTSALATPPSPTLAPVIVPTTTAPPATLPPDCVGLADATSGSRVFTGADGTQRTYELAVSRLYDGTRATPLIVNFHAHAGNGTQHDGNTLMGSLGNQRGYIVVSPDSTPDPQSWNVWYDDQRPDDFAFIHSLIAELKTTMCIDAQRVYAAGHANGGVFAASLVCTAPHEFAAVAVVAGVPLSHCAAGVQPDMLEILGTADDITLYEGRLRRPGAEESINSWAQHAGCVDPPVVVPVRDGVEALRFHGCAVADVELLSVIGGAHPWPGGVVAMNRAGNSEAGRTFPATQTILDFFDDHVGVGVG